MDGVLPRGLKPSASRRKSQRRAARVAHELLEPRLLLSAQAIDAPAPTDLALEGRLWQNLDGDGSKDADEPVLHGAIVKLFNPDGTLAAETTSESGAFRVDGLAEGWYRVSPQVPESWELESGLIRNVNTTEPLPELQGHSPRGGASAISGDTVFQARAQFSRRVTENRESVSYYNWSLFRRDLTTGEILPAIAIGEEHESATFTAMTVSQDGDFAWLIRRWESPSSRRDYSSTVDVYRVNLHTGEIVEASFQLGRNQEEIASVVAVGDRVLIASEARDSYGQQTVDSPTDAVLLYEFDPAQATVNPVLATGMPVGTSLQEALGEATTVLTASADGSTAVFGIGNRLFRFDGHSTGVTHEVALPDTLQHAVVTSDGSGVIAETLFPADRESDKRKLLTFNGEFETQLETVGKYRVSTYLAHWDEVVLEDVRTHRIFAADPLTLADHGDVMPLLSSHLRVTSYFASGADHRPQVTEDGHYYYSGTATRVRVMKMPPQLSSEATSAPNDGWVYVSRWNDQTIEGAYRVSGDEAVTASAVSVTLPDEDGLTTVRRELADIIVSHAGVEVLRQPEVALESLMIDAGNRPRTIEVGSFVLPPERPLTINGSGLGDEVSITTPYPEITVSSEHSGTVSVQSRPTLETEVYARVSGLTLTGLGDGTVHLNGNRSLDLTGGSSGDSMMLSDDPSETDRVRLLGTGNVTVTAQSPAEALRIRNATDGELRLENLTLDLPQQVSEFFADEQDRGSSSTKLQAPLQILGNDGDDRISFHNVNVTVDGDPHAYWTKLVRIYAFEGNNFVDASGLNFGALITSGNSNDTLSGGRGNDEIRAGLGNDLINGGPGNDELWGGPSDESTPSAADDNDVVNGGEGNDFMHSGAGQDSLSGDAGDDVLWAFRPVNPRQSDPVFLDGGSGDDSATGTTLQDTLIGGDGIDRVVPGGWWPYERFTLTGDELLVESANPELPSATLRLSTFEIAEFDISDTYFIDDISDTEIHFDASQFSGSVDFVGGWHADTIIGSAGNDTIDGGYGDDSILAGAGSDRVYGNRGADEIRGEDGDDTIDGGRDDDFLTGDMGDDVIGMLNIKSSNPESGDDRIWGGGGNDILWGGVGDDTVIGHSGHDAIGGGDGNDFLKAGGDSNALMVMTPGNRPGSLTISGIGVEGDDTDRLQAEIEGIIIVAPRAAHIDASASALPVAVIGSQEPDVIIGSPFDDEIDGDGGDDWILGAGGADVIEGGEGNDTLLGGGGNDWLQGNAGDDVVNGQGGRDWLSGGEGDDLLTATGPTTLVETTSADLVVTAETMSGIGDDQIRATVARAFLSGDRGNNRIDASEVSFPVILVGRAGDDTLIGGHAADRLYGNRGNDHLMGMGGADRVLGGTGHDLLEGGDGQDLLNGGSGGDELMGQTGNDLLLGGGGRDMLNGGADNDTLFGQAGNDRLYGDTGNDALLGGTSQDVLDGEDGEDTLNGGEGEDDERGASSEVDHLFSLDLTALMDSMS